MGRQHPHRRSGMAPHDHIPRPDAAWRERGTVCLAAVVKHADRGVSRQRPSANVLGPAPAQHPMLASALGGGGPSPADLRNSVRRVVKKNPLSAWNQGRLPGATVSPRRLARQGSVRPRCCATRAGRSGLVSRSNQGSSRQDSKGWTPRRPGVTARATGGWRAMVLSVWWRGRLAW